MPTVPKDQARVSKSFSEAQPSDTDMLMALAIMQQHGKISNFDERFYGADPSLPIDVQSRGRSVYGQVKRTEESSEGKADPIPVDEGSMRADRKMLNRDSIGVLGGSR